MSPRASTYAALRGSEKVGAWNVEARAGSYDFVTVWEFKENPGRSSEICAAL